MTPVAIISILGGLTMVAIAYAIYGWWSAQHTKRRQLRERLDPRLASQTKDVDQDILRTERFSHSQPINEILKRFSPAGYLRTLLIQGGISISVASVLYLVGVSALAAALILQAKFHIGRPLSLVAGTALSIMGTLTYIRYRRKRHLQAFVAQLPAALDMIRSSIHAGHSLNYALEVALEELDEPLATGFRTVLEEMRLGLSPREALDNLYRRVPVQEIKFFVLAVVLTREVGGNLSEVLGTLSTTLRDRMKLRAQIKALSAQGRASAVLLFMIPPGVGFAANVVRPGFIDPLFEHPTGRLLLGIAIGFQMIGFLLVRKIVSPKELGVV